MADNEMARFLLQQVPDRENRHATAACTPNVTQSETNYHIDVLYFEVTTTTGETYHIALSGNLRLALESLMNAGAAGYAPLGNLALIWHVYLRALRSFGVEIAAQKPLNAKEHDGRIVTYVLLSDVRLESEAP